MKFSHLHSHTQFSLLDGASPIKRLYEKAVADGMPAIAITDHGNMFGVFEFVSQAAAFNKNGLVIKPIVGCEFYVVEDRARRQFTKDDKDVRYHQLMLAKNNEGYLNLIKLCSLGYIEGLYGKYPRIDKELIEKYHKGLIATTCCLAAEVPRAIIRKGEAAAEKVFQWWLNLFGDDYYIELQRHEIPDQHVVNDVLLKWSKKYGVKVIATNDSHYVDQPDAVAHDILLCINTGEKQSTPSMKEFTDDDTVQRGKRFAFYNNEFYFKTTSEMSRVFGDIPEAIENTNEIADKVELLSLKKDIMLPHYQIPVKFKSQDDYLEYLTYEGAKKRYGIITQEVDERLKFELETIRRMGFAGYFLIVADFINHGKEIGVFVGPGRGSAAGSAVAYCIGVTNIDPIKYNLLFERFLNPDRKSMPDIDTDFDDEGRQKVIDYVVDKYGKRQVAQIVTYGTMAARSSIKDVARVLDLPLSDSNALAKMVPAVPSLTLRDALTSELEGENGLKDRLNLRPEDLESVKHLRKIMQGDDLKANVLKQAIKLEGSIRNVGVHAAGVIVAPSDITDIVPVCTQKDSELLITQFEGKVVEDAGIIKMDFLGLKNLTILRHTREMIKENHGIDLDLDKIPFDDEKTYLMFQRGETEGTFQFESTGMKRCMRELKPDKFEDLIAVNALYRPGPMAKIPNFIARKHGREPIEYDLPVMKEYLEETYGVTVYQEQVMLLSQRLANFTKGDADVIRKAMGKKQRDVLDKMKDKFIKGGIENGYDETVLQKIWGDWESFAEYAFNKSHSTCYAYLAYQTAYLKTNYPLEFMAALLTNHLNDIDSLTSLLEECRKMQIEVLGPDVNESVMRFNVNKEGKIRFGLGGIKGVGEAAVQSIVEERMENGPYKNIFDFTRRVNLRSVNKKTMESLALSGAFDCFREIHRAQYFTVGTERDASNGIEKAIRYGQAQQDASSKNQGSLFDDVAGADVPLPKIPPCEEWSYLEKLRREREVIGFYLSGHPLDIYQYEIKEFCNSDLTTVSDKLSNTEVEVLIKSKNKPEFTFAGIITKADHRVGKSGNHFAFFTLEDKTGTLELAVFNQKKYLELGKFLKEGMFVFIKANLQLNYNKDKVELFVDTIRLLNTLGAELTRSVTAFVELQMVTEAFIDELVATLNMYERGPLTLKIHLVDAENKIETEANSRKFKIPFNSTLFRSLEQLTEKQLRLAKQQLA